MRFLNQESIELIKSFEGFRLKSYQDDKGIWTLGYGHTEGVGPGQTISATQAEIWLRNDVMSACNSVSYQVTSALTDNQFGALVSFVYNLGAARLAGSTLLKLINAGDFAAAADEFPKWCHEGAQVSPGLLRRRNAERDLFLKE